MKEQEFKRLLKAVSPGMDERFRAKSARTLDAIVKKEEQMKESTKRTILTAGRFSARTAAIAAAVCLFIGAAAFAAAQWHVFDHLDFMTGKSPKNADAVMQSNLYSGSVNGVEITVKEAGYDGRTLFLQYSYRLPEVKESFAARAKDVFGEELPEGADPLEIVDGVPERAEQMLEEKQVGWWTDHLWLNGRVMDMPDNSGSVVTGSDVPGEIVHTEYWRLDNEGVTLDGPTEITLPIGDQIKPDTLFSKEKHPEKFDKDGNLLKPEENAVTFTYNTPDLKAFVVVDAPDLYADLPKVEASVTEAVYSPLMTYITLKMDAKPEALKAYKEQHPDATAMEMLGGWLVSLELVDGDGVRLFPGRKGCNGYGDDSAEFLYPHIENIPDRLWLAPIKDGRADMNFAVPVKAPPVNR